MPLSVIVTLALLALGVVNNLPGAQEISTITGGKQTILGGPVATWESIKLMSVLIYFLKPIASMIQLPQVIAGIARDLAHEIDAADAAVAVLDGDLLNAPRPTVNVASRFSAAVSRER